MSDLFFQEAKEIPYYTEFLVHWVNTRTKEFLSSQTQNIQFITWVLFWALKWKYSSFFETGISYQSKLSNFLKKAVCWNASFLSVICVAYPLVADICVYFSNVSLGNIKIKHFIIHLFYFFPIDVYARYGMHVIHCCF